MMQQMFLGYGGGGLKASGGNVDGLEPGNGYIYHTFTSPGTFSVQRGGEAEVLMVGGGGSGGTGGFGQRTGGGGGGGGGGVLFGTLELTNGSYSITIGTPGNTTAFNTTAFKGGNGSPGSYGSGGGAPGGSGGGGGARKGPMNPAPPPKPGGSGIQAPAVLPFGTLAGYGNPGVAGSSSNAGGGGSSGFTPNPDFNGPVIGVPGIPGSYGNGGGPGGFQSNGGSGAGAQGVNGVVVIRYAK